jgi:hypothetical protein
MNNSIKLAIEQLYLTFKIYKIEDLTSVSCFDYGPDVEELVGISQDLPNIPCNIIGRMEFYASGWDSWGKENEVKYFLPRLLECVAQDITRLNEPGYFSLFTYKLSNCFSNFNKDWLEEEKLSLKKFFDALLEYHLSESVEIGFLIECALTLDMLPEQIFSKWQSNEKLHKNQVINLFKHFSCLANTPEIKQLLNFVETKLSPEELATIN